MLDIRNLSVEFKLGKKSVKAVNNVSLKINENETVCLIGESGSGKSVLGLSILKLLPENVKISGEVYYKNKNLLSLPEKELKNIRGKIIAWIPQTSSALNPVITVGEQIAEPLIYHLKLDKKRAWRRVIDLLNFFSIIPAEKRAKQYPHQYSGGMKQRALVAMGISAEPEFIIADEPTKGLDIVKKFNVIEAFKKIKKKKLSQLIITHDLHLAEVIGDKISVMYCGQVLEVCNKNRFFNEPLHPYSKALLEALPDRGLKPIRGFPPSMVNPPSGCKFHPRCDYCLDICKRKEPPFFKVEDSLVRCWRYDNWKESN
ncbi:peptide ABC transporter ATPase [Methanocaldococcus villosus KIN24-T80]|uniref:Nickel import system ATP-binding protein NikD n=1 Tax=Methanocaldococcus villosus KIN24-T80 TaxID=1069083 RepID=N6VZ07_9EURY|nr:ABC transporter ATP-binding protein [Methanocaldococcus villosus]ENN96362.1 peptide ABC transporter ATPase [Methanocaldococcus villosus KIN24-T80]